MLQALRAKTAGQGLTPAEVQSALAPQTRAARRARERAEGKSSGYHAPRHRTGRPTFPPTEEELYKKHVARGGCSVRTKKGTLCRIKPLKGKTVCKVHTGKASADD